MNKIPSTVGLKQHGPGWATVTNDKTIISVHGFGHRVLLAQVITVDGYMAGISQSGGKGGVIWAMADMTVEIYPTVTNKTTIERNQP